MTEAEFTTFLRWFSAVALFMAAINLMLWRRRGPKAAWMSGAFVAMAILLQLLAAGADTGWVLLSAGALAALLVGDFVARSSRR